jgi:hypothetical protein
MVYLVLSGQERAADRGRAAAKLTADKDGPWRKGSRNGATAAAVGGHVGNRPAMARVVRGGGVLVLATRPWNSCWLWHENARRSWTWSWSWSWAWSWAWSRSGCLAVWLSGCLACASHVVLVRCGLVLEWLWYG